MAEIDIERSVDQRIERAAALLCRVEDEHQRTALEGWIGLARLGPVTRRDLKPEFYGRGLQYVDLVEVVEDGADYRHLIEGREVIRRFGRSRQSLFSDLYAATYLSRVSMFYEAVRLSRTPTLRRFSVESLAGEALGFTQLALPMTDEDGQVSHIAAVFDFPDPIARIPTAPLGMHSAWRRLERGTARETVLGDRRWR
jgi:hypothetical protein